MALEDTVARLQHQAEEKAQWEKDKPQFIKEWQDAVAALLAEIRSYLADLETGGRVSISMTETGLSEERLGRYRIAAMSISVGPAAVLVAPIGRMIIGATGRVDMYRQGRPGEADRFKLLRVQTSATDSTPQWAITPPPETGTPRPIGSRPANRLRTAAPRLAPLTKEAVRQALDALLNA